MHRKHFILIAKILQKHNESEQKGWSYDINEAFADLCESENPQFDRAKFLQACEYKQ